MKLGGKRERKGARGCSRSDLYYGHLRLWGEEGESDDEEEPVNVFEYDCRRP